MGICLAGWLIIIDFPSKAGNFLKPAEKQFVIDRINDDRGDAEEDKVTLSKVLLHLTDWKIYFWSFNLMSSTLPGYAYSYFLPIILRDGMGYSQTQSQLLSCPPYILAAIIGLISGWLGDRWKIRGPIIAVHQVLTAVGMLITVFGKSNAARYFGSFLGTIADPTLHCIGSVLIHSDQVLDFYNSVFPVFSPFKPTISYPTQSEPLHQLFASLVGVSEALWRAAHLLRVKARLTL